MLETELSEVIQGIWSTTLGLELQPSDSAAAQLENQECINGCVRISGAWNGAVGLICSMPLAKKAVAIMLGEQAADADSADVSDIIGELANMMGGGLKVLLPGPSSLSHPVVKRGGDVHLKVADSSLAVRLAFECDGQPLAAELYESGRGDHARVLIIEDTPANMKLVSGLLLRAGYEVLEAVDAEAGLLKAEVELPDLILMDIQLPGMDGLTATRQLKENEKTRDIKVVALTALAMKDDKERILKAGCDGYIAKPIRYKEFLKTVESFMHGSDKAA